MKYLIIILALTFLSGCTANQATPDKYKVCEVKCKDNGGVEYVRLFNDSFIFFDVSTSNKFRCKCANGAEFRDLDIGKEITKEKNGTASKSN